MTLNLDHTDELYLLQEAVEAFAATLDPKRQWRAVEAAQALAEKLTQIAEAESLE